MDHEKLFEKLINDKISREEFEKLLELIDDEDLRKKYDEYLYSQFLNEINKQSAAADQIPNPKEEESRKGKRVDPKRYYSIAATLVIIASVSFYVSLINTSKQELPVSQVQDINENPIEIRNTPTKRMFRTRLSDGSFVHLNVVSSISYPKKFDGIQRKVEVTGEAYFDINRDENRPFVIDARGFEVRVLGTSFNVKAYEDEEDFSITVESGKVQVAVDNKEEKIFTLTKNQKLTFSAEDGNFRIDEVNPELELSWRKGILRFDSTPFKEVEKVLERWYGVEVVIKDRGLYNKSLSGIHQNENIKSVLESITFATGTQYDIRNDTIVIKN